MTRFGPAVSAQDIPAVTMLPVLAEKDFGSCEGKKFHERAVYGNQSDEFVDVESKQSLAQRADTFLNEYLLPLFDSTAEPIEPVIVVVSHSIMLSSLWRRLLLRLPQRSVKLAPGMASFAPVTLEHLGGWSNTGYLELHMSRAALGSALRTFAQSTTPKLIHCPLSDTPCGVSLSSTSAVVLSTQEVVKNSSLPTDAVQPSQIRTLSPEWSTIIHSINEKDHLKGLKRTGGGLGSSRHDASQKSIKSFFKRRKVD